jgi:hypothetical protein
MYVTLKQLNFYAVYYCFMSTYLHRKLHFGVLKEIPFGYGVLIENRLGTTGLEETRERLLCSKHTFCTELLKKVCSIKLVSNNKYLFFLNLMLLQALWYPCPETCLQTD